MFFLEMIVFLPLMFILIGLFDVWVPREKITRHIGPGCGHLGILWVILLAMLQAGPLYAAFPWLPCCGKRAAARAMFLFTSALSAP